MTLFVLNVLLNLKSNIFINVYVTKLYHMSCQKLPNITAVHFVFLREHGCWLNTYIYMHAYLYITKIVKRIWMFDSVCVQPFYSLVLVLLYNEATSQH